MALEVALEGVNEGAGPVWLILSRASSFIQPLLCYTRRGSTPGPGELAPLTDKGSGSR